MKINGANVLCDLSRASIPARSIVPGVSRRDSIGVSVLALALVLGFAFTGSALSVTAALRPPLLLAAGRLAVASSRFPLPPPARSLSARFTAITVQRMLGPVDAPAALQQTDPAPGTMGSTLTPCGSERSGILIFARS